MTRTWMLALPAALVVVIAACGGGSGDTANTPPSPSPDPNAPATVGAGNGQDQPTADSGIPSATPASDTDIALSVLFKDSTYAPTVAEFRALPTVEIDAAGTKQRGVSLAVLAEKVGAQSGLVTVQGLQGNLQRIGYVRYPLADVGSTTVFALNAEGHVDLYSSSIPAAEWLKVVSGISFQQ